MDASDYFFAALIFISHKKIKRHRRRQSLFALVARLVFITRADLT